MFSRCCELALKLFRVSFREEYTRTCHKTKTCLTLRIPLYNNSRTWPTGWDLACNRAFSAIKLIIAFIGATRSSFVTVFINQTRLILLHYFDRGLFIFTIAAVETTLSINGTVSSSMACGSCQLHAIFCATRCAKDGTFINSETPRTSTVFFFVNDGALRN